MLIFVIIELKSCFCGLKQASRQTWIAQFLRFLLRPRPWLTESLQQIVRLGMVSPRDIIGHGEANLWSNFPKIFMSIHVRFGMKSVEVNLEPLSRYMDMAQQKMPLIRDVFLSTETEAVMQTLIRFVKFKSETKNIYSYLVFLFHYAHHLNHDHYHYHHHHHYH